MRNSPSSIRLLIQGRASYKGYLSPIAQEVAAAGGAVRQTWSTGDQLRVVADFPSNSVAAVFKLSCGEPLLTTRL